MWEIVLSGQLLGKAEGRAVFDPWRTDVRARLRQHLTRSQIQLIRYLAPLTGNFPDFLTPPQSSPHLAAGVEAIRSTPIRRLRQDLAVLADAPAWARPLADGEPMALASLGDALRSYYDAALSPYWPRVQALIEADLASRARALLAGGVDGLLNSLRPTLNWTAPVLQAAYPVDRDLYLAGRGLLMVPSVFCWRTPVTLVDADLTPVLVYPVTRGPDWWIAPAAMRSDGILAALLGSTRAATLRTLEDGCTTSELARRVGVSPGTASQHATVLREANLIMSNRLRNTVMHTLTPLGHALLKASLHQRL